MTKSTKNKRRKSVQSLPGKAGSKRSGARGGNASGAGTGAFIVILILCATAFLAVVSLPLFMIVAAGMVPTFTAFFVDREPEKYAPMTVGAFNGVGVLPFVLDLWTGLTTVNAALEILIEPFTWLVMYGAASVGWIVYLGMPTFAAVWIDAQADAQVVRLRKEQAKLLEDWGEDLNPHADDGAHVG